jgi:ribonuclease HII
VSFLIGTDEAGYGPNLGPLVITATVWRVPDEEAAAADLYRLLRGGVARRAPRAGPPRRAVIADSKAIYSPQHGLALLETGVLALLGAAGARPDGWRACWDLLTGDSAAGPSGPWYDGYDVALPVAADAATVARQAARLSRALAAADVTIAQVRSRAVFPAEFNRRVAADNKATALSELTLELVAGLLDELLDGLPPGPVTVLCDKHGGRNSYGRLLQRQFPDALVEHYGEGRAESVYRFGPASRRVEFRFRAGGEQALPVAAASMASKYLRELAMAPFNAFWCARVPDLRPTAGYPGDSRRFKRHIAAAQAELGVADDLLWRWR